MIFVTILTSSNLLKLERLVSCLEKQTNRDFDFNIVVNTLDEEFKKEVISKYGDKVDITTSNGLPGLGKNSVVRLWRSKYTGYKFYSMIDGDDLVYPTYIQALYQHIHKYPNTDVIGMVTVDVIHPDYTPECWTGNSIDLRKTEDIAELYFKDYGILSHDRLILFSSNVLDRVIFDTELKAYEDYLASLKLLQLYRTGEIEYWLTTSTDMYIYDKSGEGITSSLDTSEWTNNTILLRMKSIKNCHYSWSSTKGMLYEIPEALMSYDERRSFAETHIASRLKVYSFGTDPNKCSLMLESARKFGYNVTIEGYGQQYKGHGLKIQNMRKFCEQQDPNDVILFVDAYDVIFTQPEEVLFNKWEKLTGGVGVIFNAEINCWPDAELASEYPSHPTSRFKFLNSGIYMGRAKYILDMIPDNVSDTYDDQRYYADKFLFDVDSKIKLDYTTELFMPLCYAVTSVRYDDKGLVNSELGSHPCLLHANFTEYSSEYLETFYKLITMTNIPTGVPSQEQGPLELLKLNNYLKLFKGEANKFLPN